MKYTIWIVIVCLLSISVFADGIELDFAKAYVDGDKQTLNDNGDTIRDVRPGSELVLSLKIKNVYDEDTNNDVENIDFRVVLQNIDDGSDLEYEDEFDIDADKEKKIDIKFEMPLLVDESTYELTIDADGDNDTGHTVGFDAEYVVEIDKEKHSVVVSKMAFRDLSADCDHSAELEVRAVNIGSSDEDVVVWVSSSDLKLDKKFEAELESADDSDAEFVERIPIRIDDSVKEGTYTIRAEVEYDDDKKASKEIDLKVDACERLVVEEEGVKVEPKQEKEVRVIEEKVEQEPVLIDNTIEERKIVVRSVEKDNNDKYLVMLASLIGVMIILGLILKVKK